MILVLFFYVADVFAIEKEPFLRVPPSYWLEEPHGPLLDSKELELPAGNPEYENYGVSDFWWEASTTEWQPWWKKMNVTIPTPGIRLPPPEINVENREPENETIIETSGGENETTIVTSEGANAIVTQGEITSLKETVAQTSLDISSTVELLASTTPTAEETNTYIPIPGILDANLVAQLRAGPDLPASPQNVAPYKPPNYEKPPNYDYYGELHDDLPPNLRGPEYPGLLKDIPVILNRTDNKTKAKRPPAIPGWRLQFPDKPPNKLADGTPKLKKTTYKVNYPDYFNDINADMKMEPLPDETGILKDSSFEIKDSEKSIVTSGMLLRSLGNEEYKPAVPDSMEDDLTYRPKPFKFDEVAAGKELMALFSRAGPERMLNLPPTLKAVKALSPTYTVPHLETTGTPITEPYVNTWFVNTAEPTTTTRLSTVPTTTTRFTTKPTTTTRLTPELTTTVPSTTAPTTLRATSPTTKYDANTGTTLEPAHLTNYIQTYEVDWDAFSTMRSTFTFIEETTTPNPLIENMKNEMARKQVGYFSVSLKKFFEIFSKKENTALTALLKGASNVLEKMNKNNRLIGLGPPLWPGTELGFLKMRLLPIETVKTRASAVFMFYASGSVFDVKKLHDSVDSMYYKKEGEDLMQAITEFEAYPGINREMNATKVMEHIFKALLAPYLRDGTSPKIKSVLRDINDKLKIASERFYGDSRRNTQAESKYTSKFNYNLINKVALSENNSYRNIGYDYDDIDDTSEIPIDNIGGKKTNNATKTNAVPKRASKNKHGQNEVVYRDAKRKVRLLTDASDQIRHPKESKMGLSVKHKVTEATILYHHNKYSNNNPRENLKSYNDAKKAFETSESDHDNELIKDNNEKNTYYSNRAKSGEPNDKKWYLEIIKFNNNKSESKTNENKDSKISDIYSRDKMTVKTKYISGTYKEGPLLQTYGIVSQKIKTTKVTNKNSDFRQKTTMKTYDYETYDDETESKLSYKKEHKIKNSNGRNGLSSNKNHYYDTFDDSKDSKETSTNSKITNIPIKEEPFKENVKGRGFRNSVRAKYFVKKLKIRRTTKENEYLSDIKPYYTTTMSRHGKTFQNKKKDKIYLTSENYNIWSSTEKVDSTKTTSTYTTDNKMLQDENKIKDWNAFRAQEIDNDTFEDNVSSFENELNKKHQETNLAQHYNQFNAKESEIIDDDDDKLKLTETTIKDTNTPENGHIRLSQRVLPKRFKKIQNPEVLKTKKYKLYSPQSPKPQDVYSEAPNFKQDDLGFNKKGNILNKSVKNKNKSSDNENNKKIWLQSKSQYIVNDAAYLNEKFRNFNRDNVRTKKKYSLRNLDKNENILRVESSYSDEEEILKSNLQDNLLHEGRNFTDTLHKYKKNNPLRDVSSYSDDEDTLKKNIYKLFT